MKFETLVSAKVGCSMAMGDLLQQITRDCLGTIRHYLGNKYSSRLDAEDVLQEVLLQVATGIATEDFADLSAFKAWVFCVCRNNTYKQVAYVKSLRRSADRTSAMGEGFDAGCDDATPVEILVKREELNKLMWVASGMSDEMFQAVELMATGMSIAEVAAALGKDPGFVYQTRKALVDVCLRGKYQGFRGVGNSEKTGVAVSARMRQWKSHADKVRAIECPVARAKSIARLEKALNKLQGLERDEMAAFIGFSSAEISNDCCELTA